jgi:hypothetical protein
VDGDLVILSHWTVKLPFVAKEGDPKRVGYVKDGLWPWLKEDMTLVSLNGMEIPSVLALPAALRMTFEPDDRKHLIVKIGVGRDANGELIEEAMVLPISQDTVLANGLMFQTNAKRDTWETIFKRVPMEMIDDFYPGDRLVSYVPTGEVFDTRVAMRDIFQRERRRGVSDFEIEIDRAGQRFTRTIKLKPVKPVDKPAIENAVLMSSWSVRMPFQGDQADPTAVGDINESMWAWARPGVKLLSVNGVKLDRISALPSLLRQSIAPEDQMQMYVKVEIDDAESGTTTEELLVLPIIQDTVLRNGMRFETDCKDSIWATRLISYPDTLQSDLRPGDKLIGYAPTNEMFDARTSLADVLQRERRKGMAEFEVMIERNGEKMTKVITL